MKGKTMAIYHTLFSEDIDLGRSPLDRRTPEAFVLREYEKGETALKTDSSGKVSETYYSYVYGMLQGNYFSRAKFHQVLGGSVGVIYRDCYYRLRIEELCADGKQERMKVLFRLRYHPMRFLIDARLHDAGLETFFSERELKEIFEAVWYGRPVTLSFARITRAIEALGLIPILYRGVWSLGGRYKGASAIPEQFFQHPMGITVRERQILNAVAEFAGRVFTQGVSREAYETLGYQIALAYGIDDLLILDRVTHRIAEDILLLLRRIKETPSTIEHDGARAFVSAMEADLQTPLDHPATTALEIVEEKNVKQATRTFSLWQGSVPFQESFEKLRELVSGQGKV